MSAGLVLAAIVLIGALFGRAAIWASGIRGAVWTGIVLGAVGIALAVRQVMKAQAAPDGWTGIAEALGAAFILLALIGYWVALGVVAWMRRARVREDK